MEEKKTNKLPIIILIIVAIGLGIGGFYLGESMNKQDKCLEQEQPKEETKEETKVVYERTMPLLKKSDLSKINYFMIASVLNLEQMSLEDKLDNKNILETELFKEYFAFIYGSYIYGDYYIAELEYNNEMQFFTTAQGASSIRFEDYKAIYESIYGTKFTKDSVDAKVGQVATSSHASNSATMLCSSIPTGMTDPLTFEFKESDFKDGEGIADIKGNHEEYEFDGKIKVTYNDLGNDTVNITGIYLYK